MSVFINTQCLVITDLMECYAILLLSFQYADIVPPERLNDTVSVTPVTKTMFSESLSCLKSSSFAKVLLISQVISLVNFFGLC